MENMLPALGGEHYFANRPKPISFQKLPFLARPSHFVTAKCLLALSIFNTKRPLKIKMGDMQTEPFYFSIFFVVDGPCSLYFCILLLPTYAGSTILEVGT